MSFMDFSGHIAFFLIACSFLVQNILTLRIISILSCIAAIIYNYYAVDKPLWLVIAWNIIFIGIHVINISIYFYKKRKIDFNPEEKEIYEKVFKDLSHIEFMHLIQIGKVLRAKKNMLIMCEGKNCDRVILILDGKVELSSKGSELTDLEKGDFIGENHIFNAKYSKTFLTAQVIEPTKYIIWHKKNILKYLKDNSELKNSFISIVNKNMEEKLRNIVKQ